MTATLDPPLQQNEVSLWMFLRSLKASKLLADDEIAEWEERANSDPLLNLPEALVAEGLITAYQLDRLNAGNPYGLVLGQYRILDELGKGGCGQVYKAHHRLMDRTVALKMIAQATNRSTSHRDLFIREVVATTRLLHPNIATAYDANEQDGQLYFAMEYIEGPTLHHLVQTNGPLPVSIVCSYMLQAAEALRHAHEKGIVHRDIKPANIMLTSHKPNSELHHQLPNVLKILDFGLCRVAERKSRIMSTIPCDKGAIVGTPAFIAPEQISDLHEADGRSDIYSLGCSFYYALTGMIPFDGLNTRATLLLHLERDAMPMTAHRAAIPSGLNSIVSRMMAKKPFDRFQSAADLSDAINHFVLNGGLGESGRIVNVSRPLPQAESDRHAAKPSSQLVLQPAETKQVVVQLVMPEQTPSPDDTLIAYDQMPMLWTAWFDVVNGFATGQPLRMSAAEYKALYRNLMEIIAVTGHQKGSLVAHLQSVVEPWVTLKSLLSLDVKGMKELVANARQAEEIVWADRKQNHSSRSLLMWIAVAAVGIAVIAAVIWLKPFGLRFGR